MPDLVMDVSNHGLFCFGQFVLIFLTGYGTVKLETKCNQLIYIAPEWTDVVELTLNDVFNYKPIYPNHEDHYVSMDPCQQDSKMKIIWELPKVLPSENHAIFCLKHVHTDAMLNEELACYNFTVPKTEKKSEVHCSVTIPSYKDILLMKTYVTINSKDGPSKNMYGEASSLDVDPLCLSERIDEPTVDPLRGCNTNGMFKVVETDSVKAIIAKDTQNNTRILSFKSRDDGYTEFTLDASMNGSYTLQIVIYRQDIYMTIERNIHVICHVDKMPPPSADPKPSGFLTFLAVMSLGVVIIVAIIITFIWICGKYRQRNVLQQRATFERRRSSIRYPLNNAAENQPCLRGANGIGVRNGRPSSRLSGIELETMDSRPNTDRHVMILPMSYDHYVRDLVDCLKQLLSFQGRITCKCVFDPPTMSDYKRDKYEWISTVLNNPGAIVLVLCFTSPHDHNRESTCVDEILKHCKQDRIKPQCQLYLLNMTGRDFGPSLHHGETIVVQNRAQVEGLLKKLFSLCGFNSDQEESLLHEPLRNEHLTQSINKLLFHK